MTLEEAEALLKSRGLYARCLGNNVLRVARRIAPRGEDIPLLEEASGIHLEAGVWHFSYWSDAPHDGDFPAQSLDEAVALALRWYFGEPRVGD